MIFRLTTSGYYYEKCSDVRKLEKLGFTFKRSTDNVYNAWERDNSEPTIQIDSLEELMKFQGQVGAIILNGDRIEIYDDYRE